MVNPEAVLTNPVVPIPKVSHKVRNFGCGGTALLLILVGMAVAGGSKTSTNAPAKATTSAPAVTVPKPPSAQEQAATYAKTALTAIGPLPDAMGNVKCGGSYSINECLLSVTAIHDLALTARGELRNDPAPACLATAAASLNHAVDLVVLGTTQQIAGINALDVAQIQAGTATVDTVTPALNQASGELTTGMAACGK